MPRQRPSLSRYTALTGPTEIRNDPQYAIRRGAQAGILADIPGAIPDMANMASDYFYSGLNSLLDVGDLSPYDIPRSLGLRKDQRTPIPYGSEQLEEGLVDSGLLGPTTGTSAETGARVLAGFAEGGAPLVAGTAADAMSQSVRKLVGPLKQPRWADTEPVFYSPLTKAAEELRMPRATPGQWLATLKKQQGVKEAELEHTNLEGWLNAQKGSVSKDELTDYLKSQEIEIQERVYGNDPSFEVNWYTAEADGRVDGDPAGTTIHKTQYDEPNQGDDPRLRFPGGENYRELVLSLPKKSVMEDYYGSHFGMDPNAIAHIRFIDRTDADGGKVLFIEEIQSDWAQQGRRSGWQQSPEEMDVISGKLTEVDTKKMEVDRKIDDFYVMPKVGDEIPFEILRWGSELDGNTTMGFPMKMVEIPPSVQEGKNPIYLLRPELGDNGLPPGYEVTEIIASKSKAVEGEIPFWDDITPSYPYNPPMKNPGYIPGMKAWLVKPPGAGTVWGGPPLSATNVRSAKSREEAFVQYVEEMSGNSLKRATEKSLVELPSRPGIPIPGEDTWRYNNTPTPQLEFIISKDTLDFQTRSKQRMEFSLEDADSLDKLTHESNKFTDRIDSLEGQMAAGTPNAPLVKDTTQWTGLAIKRMIRWAADNNYDKIGWTTGAQQHKRFPTAKSEEGMAGFYDKIVPSLFKKFGKKMGAKIEKSPVLDREDMSVGVRGVDHLYQSFNRYEVRDGVGDIVDSFPTKKEAEAYFKENIDDNPSGPWWKIVDTAEEADEARKVWTMTVPEALRESAKKGLPYYSIAGGGLLGEQMVPPDRESDASLL